MSQYNMPSETIHNASTGFQDIKPLPEFKPFLWEYIVYGIAALVLIWLVYRLVSNLNRKNSGGQVTANLPPHQKALLKLDSLERLRDKGEITIRDFSAELSTTLRQYLEISLLFPANELTKGEVLQGFPIAIKTALPYLESNKFEKLYSDVKELLTFCDVLSFSDETEYRYTLNDDSLPRAITTSKELVRSIAYYLGKEAERSASISGRDSKNDISITTSKVSG